ncbi:response regulator [candidate division KSB1 bacterium]|nr:response regulator [candidate division KSB1 bacterium]
MQRPEPNTASSINCQDIFSGLRKISHILQEPIELSDKLKTAFDFFGKAFPFRRALLFLYKDNDSFKVLHAHDWNRDEYQELESRTHDFLPKNWAFTDLPFTLIAGSTKKSHLPGKHIALPLNSSNKPYGLIVFNDLEIDLKSDENVAPMQLFGNLITGALKNNRLEWESHFTLHKYQNFLEQANFPIFACTPEGLLTETNRAFLDLIGEADEENVLNTNLCAYIENDPSKENVVNLLNKYGYYRNLEVHITPTQGQSITALLTLSPIGYSHKKHLGYQGILQDISERYELEQQLMQAQKIGVLGTLASGIAHDFNNLIGGIMGCASLVLTSMRENNPHYDDIQTILKASQKAGDLAAQLLTFSRKDKVQIKGLNVNDTIREVLKLLSRTIDKSIQIKTELCSDTAIIEANATRIQQALLNICINARDAMSDGGLLIVESDNLILTESDLEHEFYLKPGLYVRIRIKDTGSGIDEETLDNIFKPFFTTKPTNEGHGLGLSIAAEVVEAHNGMINVDSELGKGTTFELHFPASLNHNSNINDVIEETNMPSGNETLMIVDDEEIILRMGKRMLERFGYNVLVASTGNEAIELFDTAGHVDLLILDMVMPKMNGWETLSQIRKMDPQVKALLTSGHNQEQLPEEKHPDGFNGYIHKPFMTGQILRLIRQTLDTPIPQ